MRRVSYTRLLLRIAGGTTWLVSGIPAALFLRRDAAELGCGSARLLWLGAFLLEGALFWATSGTAEEPSPPARWLALLALQSAAALGMFFLICTGFESTLLIIVSIQLGLMASLRLALSWTIGQTVLLAWLGTYHWKVSAALGWAGGTFGIEILALLAAHLAAREGQAKRALSRAYAELRATQDLLAAAGRIAERVRISRELHDVLGHNLVALNLHLEVAVRAEPEPARQALGQAQSIAKGLLTDVRAAVSTLRTEDRVPLRTALQRLTEAVPGLTIHLTLPDDLLAADPTQAQTIIRCVQELITNTLKHAGAQNLWIELAERDGMLELRSRDDGRGAAAIVPGQGLRGMRERVEEAGGKLSILSSSEEGFAIHATLPLSGATR